MPTLDINGYAVNVRDVGQGPPVILLHSSSSHGGQWKRLSDEICNRFRVLAPDFHGYGQSDPLPQDGQPYFQHDAAIVNALLDSVDTPAHLVGHSLGGTIAVRVSNPRPGSDLRFKHAIKELRPLSSASALNTLMSLLLLRAVEPLRNCTIRQQRAI